MTKLKPNKNIHKFLISSPCHFVGEFENKYFLITHAFPQTAIDFDKQTRYYYIVVIKLTQETESGSFRVLPDYSYIGDIFCVLLTILFGKYFENHGFLETHGTFHFPVSLNKTQIFHDKFNPYNDIPRRDLGIDLNFSNFKLIEPLLIKNKYINVFEFIIKAGKLYNRSLQIFEYDPELAYIDLVNSGEILSNYYKYSEKELFDNDLLTIFKKLSEELKDGEKIANNIKNRLYQVKRKYVLTIIKLLNDNFYSNTESINSFTSLSKNNIEKRIKAVYDLRSLYLHTGISFGSWLIAKDIKNETTIGVPVIDNLDLKKILSLTPTYAGLERIMRYCLISFIHKESCKIDERLN